MAVTTPYLNFDGKCREAMQFYNDCLGGELTIMTFGDVDPTTAADAKDRVMHARILQGGAALLMASDTMPGMPYHQGNSVHISVDCASDNEVDVLFKSLSAGGRTMMEPQDTFWNAHFAMFSDKFGFNWMLNHDRPPAA